MIDEGDDDYNEALKTMDIKSYDDLQVIDKLFYSRQYIYVLSLSINSYILSH